MKLCYNIPDMDHDPRYHLKYKICVSGAAETGHCSPNILEMAQEIGREIAKRNLILVTGATSGIPYWAAKAVKEAGGFVVGLSPAPSKESHLKTYHLPVDYHDIIIYTGFYYAGRNLLLTRASDAIIVICGRMGTLNEFTIAFEDDKPVGVLEGSGGVADMLKDIIKNSHRGPGRVVFDTNPRRLLDKIVQLITKEKRENNI